MDCKRARGEDPLNRASSAPVAVTAYDNVEQVSTPTCRTARDDASRSSFGAGNTQYVSFIKSSYAKSVTSDGSLLDR